MGYFNQKRFTMRQVVGLLAVAFLGIAVIAYAVTVPNTFTSGTPISSSQVNANFTALNNGLPQMWADTDDTFGGTPLTGSGQFTANSVSITVPSGGGFLIISGLAFVNNDSLGIFNYVLRPKIDGNDIISVFSAFLNAAGNNAAGESGTLSYTLTVPISAGAHTVSQALGPQTGTSDFFYNREHLTVLFIPASQGSVTPGTILPFFIPQDEATSSSMGN